MNHFNAIDCVINNSTICSDGFLFIYVQLILVIQLPSCSGSLVAVISAAGYIRYQHRCIYVHTVYMCMMCIQHMTRNKRHKTRMYSNGLLFAGCVHFTHQRGQCALSHAMPYARTPHHHYNNNQQPTTTIMIIMMIELQQAGIIILLTSASHKFHCSICATEYY